MRTTTARLLALTLPLLVLPIAASPARAGYVVVDENGDRTLISEEQMMKMMERMGAQGGAQTKAPPAPAPAKPRRVSVQATGETATIAGLPKRKYSVLADGRPYEDLWLTPDPGIASEMALDRKRVHTAPRLPARVARGDARRQVNGPRQRCRLGRLWDSNKSSTTR
jgi:hypothetical protein